MKNLTGVVEAAEDYSEWAERGAADSGRGSSKLAKALRLLAEFVDQDEDGFNEQATQVIRANTGLNVREADGRVSIELPSLDGAEAVWHVVPNA